MEQNLIEPRPVRQAALCTAPSYVADTIRHFPALRITGENLVNTDALRRPKAAREQNVGERDHDGVRLLLPRAPLEPRSCFVTASAGDFSKPTP